MTPLLPVKPPQSEVNENENAAPNPRRRAEQDPMAELPLPLLPGWAR